MDAQIVANVVVDKPELPESVHEEADPRAGRPDHLCQSLLTQSRHRHFGDSFFAELRHQQQNSRQPLFAGIEKLIDQIVLISDVPLQQILDEHGRQFWFPTHGKHHRLLLDMKQDAVCHCGCRRHADDLAGKTAFSKEIPFAQNAKSRLFSGLRYNAELHLSLLDKKQSVGQITLSEYRVPFSKGQHISALPDGRKKGAGIETDYFLYGGDLFCQWPSSLEMSPLSIMGERISPRLVCNAHNCMQERPNSCESGPRT